jgi:hypothetical protein
MIVLLGVDQPSGAEIRGGGVGGSRAPGHIGPQPGQRARVAAAQVGERESAGEA